MSKIRKIIYRNKMKLMLKRFVQLCCVRIKPFVLIIVIIVQDFIQPQDLNMMN